MKLHRLTLRPPAIHYKLTWKIPVTPCLSSTCSGTTSGWLRFDENLEITGAEEFSENLSFVALNFFGEAALSGYYQLTDKISLEMLAGYEYNIPGRLRWSENKKAYLQNQEKEPVRADWSGIRFKLGAAYQLSGK
ncbi:hypothetical protein DSECCO2_185950 [anaerobic digester metagenome]